jgi:hypothetical protein
MWGGTIAYLASEYTDTILSALVQFANDAPSDPNAALIVPFVYTEGMFIIAADLEYAVPTSGPAIFETFLTTPSIENTVTNATLPEITLEFNASNPGGYRQTYWTATYAVDLNLFKYIVSAYENATLHIVNVTDLIPALVLQIITTDELSHMSKYGGNALGLTVEEGPLLLLNLAYSWSEPSDDYTVISTCQAIINQTLAYAKSQGLANEYLYMNYASQYEDVVPSYNSTNHARLVEISQKYDPEQVFEKLQPGYFKLNGAPAGSVIPEDI